MHERENKKTKCDLVWPQLWTWLPSNSSFHSSAQVHKRHKHALSTGLKLRINVSGWENPPIAGSTNKEDGMLPQWQFSFCSITAMWHSASYLSSVYWFLLLHVWNFYSTFKTHKPSLPPWGLPNKHSWKWNVYFLLSHLSFMDICHSSVTVLQMMVVLLE